MPSGLIPATTTTNQTNVGLNITDIVEQINIANITGVSAVNANNRVKITSTNSTLVIGSGTANSTIGSHSPKHTTQRRVQQVQYSMQY